MKIYLQTSTHNYQKSKNALKKVIKFMESQEYEFCDNALYKSFNASEATTFMAENIEEERRLFNESDIVMMETTLPSFGMGALFSLGVISKKRVLCLYQEDSPEVSDIILTYSSPLLSRLIYNEKNLIPQLKKYEKELKNQKFQKFNFVATSEIVDYLTEMSEKLGKSKSEYLRDLIDSQRNRI